MGIPVQRGAGRQCVWESIDIVGALENLHLTYVVAIRSNHGVWLPPGEPRPVHQLASV